MKKWIAALMTLCLLRLALTGDASRERLEELFQQY